MDELTEGIVKAIEGLEEAKRLEKLNAKGWQQVFTWQRDELIEELVLTLDYLEIDKDTFLAQLNDQWNDLHNT